MVALVLDHARMEALHGALDGLAALVGSAIAQPPVARHHAPEPRNRKASLPALLHFRADEIDYGIDENGVRHFFDVRIAWVGLDPENHHAQRCADLRRGQSRAVQVRHGFTHVFDERAQLRRVEALHFGGALQQAGVAHSQHVANHVFPASCSIMRATRSMPFLSTASISSRLMRDRLSPRPAAKFATTAMAA